MLGIDLDALSAVLTSVSFFDIVLFLAAGTLVGLCIGAIPGLSPPLGVALGLPLAFLLPFHQGIALLVGLYKGAIFGGSTTAISFGTPGEPAAAAIVADGYALTKRGEGGKALKTSLYSATLADTASDIVLICAAIPLGMLAPLLGPAELTGLFFAALTLIIVFSDDAPRGIIAAGFGFFLGAIGRDVQTGTVRLDFGIDGLRAGVPLVALLLGLFAVPQLIEQLHALWAQRGRQNGDGHQVDLRGALRQRLPLREFLANWRGLSVGTLIGCVLGALPGPGSTLAAYTAYAVSKQISRRPEEYGTGSYEGIASAEAANNAVSGANLIPLLTFGIPGSAVAGLFGAALLMKGVPPGPRVIVDHPEAIYTLFVIFILGNVVVLGLGRLLIPVFARIALVPAPILWPTIALTAIVGAYAYELRPFDIWVVVGGGLLGYLFRVFRLPLGPLVLAFLVGPLFEESLIRGLVLSGGNPAYFVGSAIAGAMWGISALTIVLLLWSRWRSRVRIAFMARK